MGRFGKMGKFLTNSFNFLNKCALKPLAMKVEGGGFWWVEKMGGGVKWLGGG